MPRPKKVRKISHPPKMKGFKPFGQPQCKTETIKLTYEEYESLRLINYELLSQEVAAEQMNVSRPTFTRIYNCALKCITTALVEGKTIMIEGGDYKFEKDWYRCRKCHRLIEGLENHTRCEGCDDYSNEELTPLNPE